MPVRIQRKRSRGWKFPEGAVYVGRPTQWGNPYVVGRKNNPRGEAPKNQVEAVEWFRETMVKVLAYQPNAREALEKLRGKDLVCWCALGKGTPCHADVLLELANK